MTVLLPIRSPRRVSYSHPWDRNPMTLCMASICNNQEAIVAVSDTKIAYAFTGSSDPVNVEAASSSAKIANIGGWRMMYAGDDISRVPMIIHDIQVELSASAFPRPHRFVIVQQACIDAYKAYWQVAVEDELTLRYKASYEDLINGAAPKNLATHKLLFEAVGKFETPIDFLVYGFDELWPHIFLITSPGQARSFDMSQYGVVGDYDVMPMAMQALGKAKLHSKDVPGVVLSMCEAKFALESDTIGEETMVTILWKRDEQYLGVDDVKRLREKWRSSKKPLGDDDYKLCREIVIDALDHATWYSKLMQDAREERRQAEEIAKLAANASTKQNNG